MKEKTKRIAGKGITSPYNFKTYQNGGCIFLESREEVNKLINVCNIRYYDHLAVDPKLDDSILVLWENENGDPPKEKDGHFDIDQMKLLRLEIYWHKESNKYQKIISITFRLTGKKHSVVIAGFAAQDWIDYEFPVLRKLLEMPEKNQKKIINKSRSEPFMDKLTESPKIKGKLTTIDVGVHASENNKHEWKQI